ncbi:hypothetical protein COK69_26735, partial [Bacillus cereus]
EVHAVGKIGVPDHRQPGRQCQPERAVGDQGEIGQVEPRRPARDRRQQQQGQHRPSAEDDPFAVHPEHRAGDEERGTPGGVHQVVGQWMAPQR